MCRAFTNVPLPAVPAVCQARGSSVSKRCQLLASFQRTFMNLQIATKGEREPCGVVYMLHQTCRIVLAPVTVTCVRFHLPEVINHNINLHVAIGSNWCFRRSFFSFPFQFQRSAQHDQWICQSSSCFKPPDPFLHRQICNRL